MSAPAQRPRPPFEAVACGACRACCRWSTVELREDDDPAIYRGNLIDSDGILTLRRNPDGSCVYLTAGGCSIWPHHPVVCRAFDCIAMAVLAEKTGWKGDPDGSDDEVLAAGRERAARIPDTEAYVMQQLRRRGREQRMLRSKEVR